jgi:hypothetical protein
MARKRRTNIDVPPEVRAWLSRNGRMGGQYIKQALAEFHQNHPGVTPKDVTESTGVKNENEPLKEEKPVEEAKGEKEPETAEAPKK